MKVTLRQTMSAHLGVLRDGEGMREALDTILHLARESHSVRFDNVITTAKLIAVARSTGSKAGAGISAPTFRRTKRTGSGGRF
jgi:L-aspartate oxidase